MNHEKTIELIQKLVPSVMDLDFGCEVSLYSIGMWGHKASNYYYKVISEKNLDGGGCMDRVLLLRESGFQKSGSGWKPKIGYPETLEITSYWEKRNTENQYELTKGYFHKDFKIVGKPITLAVVLRAFGKAKIDVGASVSFRNNGELGHMFPQGASLKPEPIKNTHVSVDTRGGLWNLSKDNFNDQSDETKTFVGELLN